MSEQLMKYPAHIIAPNPGVASSSQANSTPFFARSSLVAAASMHANHSPIVSPLPDLSSRALGALDKRNSSGLFLMSLDDEDDATGRDMIHAVEQGFSERLSLKGSVSKDLGGGNLNRLASASNSNTSQRKDSVPGTLPSIQDDEDKNLDAIDLWNGETSLERTRWHEVQAVPVQDPVTGKDAVLLLQTDITTRAIMEQRMAALTESQLSMLEEMFPRHVLEFIMGAAPPEATLGDLAYQHDDVTILFMDIVGFTSMSKEVPPQMVMEFLNSLFSKFDLLLDEYNVYKVSAGRSEFG